MNSTPATRPSNSPVSAHTSMVHRQAAIARWAAFAVLAWMFVPLFTGRIYVCDDLLNYHLPIRHFYAECLRHGDAFDWMPSLFSGFFLTGSGQAGTYHPWHWVLYRFLPLPTAFNLEILCSYPFMLFGMKLFLQRHLQRPDAAWLGAIVFAFSGFNMLHFLHPNAVAVVSHIPWLLLTQDIILRSDSVDGRRRISAEAGIAVLTASQLLLGYPQYVWFSLLAESVYSLAFAARSWRGVAALTLIASLKLSGLALGAVQILPSIDALSASERTAMPTEYFFQHPLSPADMLQWIGPFLTKTRVFGANTHELGVYCGALPLLLAIVAVWTIRRRDCHARLIRTMIVLGVISLWLSFGKPGGLYVLQTWLPLIGTFRWPSRIVVLLHLVLAVLAAAGYAKLTASVDNRAVRLPGIVLMIPPLSLVAAAGVYIVCGPEVAAPLSLLAIGPILFWLAILILKDVYKQNITVGFMLFVVGDLAAYGLTYEAVYKTQSMEGILADLKSPPGRPDGGRIIVETHLSDVPARFSGNDLLLGGWQQADGYEGLMPRMWLLDHNLSLEELQVSGVRWIVNSGKHSTLAGLKATGDAGWFEVPDPLPRVRLTSSVRRIDDPKDAVALVSATGPVIVDQDLTLWTPGVEARSSAAVTLDRPGLIEISTESEGMRLLVLNERFSQAWNVSIDGSKATVVRAEVDFMGCVVPNGRHSIRFSFEPDSLKTGRWISAVTLMLLVLYAAVRFGMARPV